MTRTEVEQEGEGGGQKSGGKRLRQRPVRARRHTMAVRDIFVMKGSQTYATRSFSTADIWSGCLAASSWLPVLILEIAFLSGRAGVRHLLSDEHRTMCRTYV